MAILQLEAPWEKVKAMLMETVPSLTEEDLHYLPGEEDDTLIKHLATKMSRTDEEIRRWIESVSHTDNKAS